MRSNSMVDTVSVLNVRRPCPIGINLKPTKNPNLYNVNFYDVNYLNNFTHYLFDIVWANKYQKKLINVTNGIIS